MTSGYARYLAAKTTVDDRALNGHVLAGVRRLMPAVASLAAEHVTGKAFTVQAHQRQPGRGRPAEFAGPRAAARRPGR